MKQSAWQAVMGILLLEIVALILWQAGTLVSVQNHKVDADKVKSMVVVDTGYGGNDLGKVGISEQLEKDISLKIVQRLKEYLETVDIRAVLTRGSDQGLYSSGDSHKRMADVHRRCEMIDEANPDLVVSIHQNSYHKGYVSGSQAFYHKTSGKEKYLAKLLQKRFNCVLGEANGRLTKANNNYCLFFHVKTPIIIMGCGFLSNSKGTARLEEKDYQDRMAWAIHTGTLQYLNTMGNQIAKQ